MDTLTPQQVFDKVATHLLTQKAQADAGGFLGCRYKTAAGLKCAVGCLIPDELYDSAFRYLEGKRVRCWPPERLADCGLTPEHVVLLTKLQGVHDTHAVEKWAGSLREVAGRFSLNPDITKTLEV